MFARSCQVCTRVLTLVFNIHVLETRLSSSSIFTVSCVVWTLCDICMLIPYYTCYSKLKTYFFYNIYYVVETLCTFCLDALCDMLTFCDDLWHSNVLCCLDTLYHAVCFINKYLYYICFNKFKTDLFYNINYIFRTLYICFYLYMFLDDLSYLNSLYSLTNYVIWIFKKYFLILLLEFVFSHLNLSIIAYHQEYQIPKQNCIISQGHLKFDYHRQRKTAEYLILFNNQERWEKQSL